MSEPTPPGSAPPTSAALRNFERMLAAGQEHAKAGDWAAAVDALAHAVALDPTYTAAWKLYAKALEQAGQPAKALETYRHGIIVARQKGDRQAEKEMTVFARRIERAIASL